MSWLTSKLAYIRQSCRANRWRLVSLAITLTLIDCSQAMDSGWAGITAVPPAYHKLSAQNVLRCGKLCERQGMCAAATFDNRERVCHLHNTEATPVNSNNSNGRYLFKKYPDNQQKPISQPTCDKDSQIAVPTVQKQENNCRDIKEKTGSCQPSTLDRSYKYNSTVNVCYALRTTPKSWPEAQKNCTDEGGHLLYYSDSAINEWAVALLKHTSASIHDVFVDGKEKENSGQFMNYRDEQIQVTFWKQEEPNHSGRGPHCIALHPGYDYKWIVAQCWSEKAFICQIDI